MDKRNQYTSCNTCSSSTERPKKLYPVKAIKNSPILSSLSTILLIILPKCPLCIMAYSGTFVFLLDVEYASMSAFLTYAQPVLIAFIIVSVSMNYHGKKTWYAIGVILIASSFILYESFSYIEIIDKRFAIGAIFLACWFNGNFTFVFRAVRNLFLKLSGNSANH